MENKDEVKPSTIATNSSAASAPAPSPKLPAWHPATESLQLGNISLKILKVVKGKVPLKESFGNDNNESKDALLTVYVEIKNTSENKKIEYHGWMNRSSIIDDRAELTDNHDNKYRMVSFGSTTRVRGMTTFASIYPGKTNPDAIVFEEPVESTETLHLLLPGDAVGEEGEFRFEIPASMIKSE